MDKYLHLAMVEELNIAVIKCNADGNFLPSQVETALAEHFDAETKIIDIEEISRHPLQFMVTFSYNVFDDEVVKDVAYLNETWLY